MEASWGTSPGWASEPPGIHTKALLLEEQIPSYLITKRIPSK